MSLALEKTIGEERRYARGEMTMRCPNCGRDNADGVRFCQWCGAAFLASVPSPVYGARVETKQSMSSMFLAIGLVVVGLWALTAAASWWVRLDFRWIDIGVGAILLTLGVFALTIKK